MCGISAIVALREHTKTWDRPTRPSAFQTTLLPEEDTQPTFPPAADDPFPYLPKTQMSPHVSRRYERQRVLQDLTRSLDMINHRGPDSRNHWMSEDTRVALGHVRLSINDLSNDGKQPFHSPDGKIHAVVNGEFYDYDRIRKEIEDTTDYVFRSKSDSEIVIALYMHHGLNFVQHLRGEFAVVLFDKNEQHVIALRDRFGIKPLFWTIRPDPETYEPRLLIASEMKAFLPLGWEAEWDVRSLMDAGWNHDERTIFKGIQNVRPGHYMMCTIAGRIEQRQYWDAEYPDKNTVDPRTPQEMVEGVRERMLEAIKLRLRADVPIGIYLSGGIDSSVIAGMVTHLINEKDATMGSAPASEKVCCFSIAFDEASGFDESSIADRTAKHLEVKFVKKHMNEAELAKRFEDATYHAEHHNPDLNFVGKFALSELPLKHGYKVVLTGEGADEHFAGYPAFLPDYLREPDAAWTHADALPESEREQQLQLAEGADKAYYDSVGADTTTRGPNVPRTMLNNISTVSSMVAFQPTGVFADWTYFTHGSPDPQRTVANNIDGVARQKIVDKWHPLNAAQYVWGKGHLPNIFLTCLGDRTEMAHSIEARTPLLDHKLTEYVNNLPPSAKIHWQPPSEENPEGRFVEKWVLREAAKPYITQELYERKKHPYSAPTTWPRDGPLHKLLAGLLTQENVEELGFVSWLRVEWLVERAFGEEKDPGSMRTALVVAEWVVLSKRFGVAKALPTSDV